MQVLANDAMSIIGRDPSYQPPTTQSAVEIPQDVRSAVNAMFKQLCIIFPAWKSAFPKKDIFIEARRLWLETLVSEGVTTAEQLQAGIEQAKKSTNPFFPALGEFIEWCKVGGQCFGLPTPEDLLSRYRQFRASDCETAEEFDWQSAVEHHLVLQLKRAIYHGNLSEEKTLIRAKVLISDMAKYLRNGSMVAEPTVPKLPETVIKPVSDEQKSANFKNLKAILRGAA